MLYLLTQVPVAFMLAVIAPAVLVTALFRLDVCCLVWPWVCVHVGLPWVVRSFSRVSYTHTFYPL